MTSHAQGDAAKDSGSYGPIVAIVSPEYADVLKGETKIIIDVKARRYQVQGVELLVDGKAVTGVLAPQRKFTWKTQLFVDGPHTLGVRVTDIQGFIGQAETMVYINNARKTDASAPILRWLGVENGQKLSGVAHVQVEAGDNFGVKYVFFSVNSAITPDVKPVLASWIINRPPYEVAIDTTRYKDGMYVLDALAFDAADNERNAPRLTLSFSNSASDAPDANSTPENPATDSPKPGTPAAPTTEGSPRIAPPRVTPSPQPQASPPQAPAKETLPQGTIVTTGKSSIVDAPATRPASGTTKPITKPGAVISRPPVPARDTPQPNAQTPEGEVAVSNSVAPAVSKPLESQVRISASLRDKAGQAPSVSVAGNDRTNESAIAILQSLNNARLAVAPEIRWTTPGEFRNDAKTNSKASTTVASHQPATSAWGTPSSTSSNIQPLTGETRSLQLTTPQTIAPQNNASTNSGAQLSQSVLNIGPSTRIVSIEPTHQREPLAVSAVVVAPTEIVNVRSANKVVDKPVKVATTSASKSSTNKTSARPTSIAQNQNLQPVFPAPVVTSRAATDRNNLPTTPRVAFSPNLGQPNAPALANAAIVVSPTTDAPIIHIAQNNETLAAIAARYKMPTSAIAAANNLKPNAKVAKGTKVLLPQALLVSYQGQAVTGDVAPVLIGTTSVAPFRFLFEKQGGAITWDATGQRVTARNASYEVNLEIGSNVALVNKQEVMMDMAAFLLSGRTMVPVRFFEKALQAKVEWDPSTGRIFVAMTP